MARSGVRTEHLTGSPSVSDDHAFSPDWLRLREPHDHAARSVGLVARLAGLLPPAPHVLEMASGLGSGARFVSAHLGCAAHWTLVDHDPRLLAAARTTMEAWARRHPDRAPRSLDVQPLDLRAGFPDGPWDAVVTQALLDLVSESWLDELADWLEARRIPFLGALTVDGRVHWHRPHPLDAEVQAAFRAHQQLDRGFGPSPGPRAAPLLAEKLEARGFEVRLEPADWQIPAEATQMLGFMVDGTAEAARVTHAVSAQVDAWHVQRTEDVRCGRVSLTVGHQDLLASPAR